jgi:transcriptional regulator with XRE-family HTH domain
MRQVDDFYASLGSAIRVRRNEIELTQQDLASLVGLSRTSITNIERGQQRLLADQLLAVSKSLDIGATELLERASLEQRTDRAKTSQLSLDAFPDLAQFVANTLEGLRETSK